MKNIARKFLYGWSLWENIERERRGIRTNQMERWHLRDMHQRIKVSYLTRWLSSHVATRRGKGDVTVSSTWIDHRPQAHSYYLATAGATASQVSVELADLLLVVRVRGVRGSPISERALLLQAKCVDHPVSLDSSYAGKSTVKERHLLEACCASIKITGLPGLASNPINSARTDYDLGASLTKLGLKSYARYLLVPRKKLLPHLPYMTVWPSALSAHSGSPAHFAEVVLAMTEVTKPGGFPGADVNTSAATTGWDHLVKDLMDYCNGLKPLNRFKSKTGLTFPPHVESTYDVGSFHRFRAIFRALLQKLFEGSWLERSLRLQMMPDGDGKMPPPEMNDDAQDEPIGGFTLLQITINDPDRLEPLG